MLTLIKYRPIEKRFKEQVLNLQKWQRKGATGNGSTSTKIDTFEAITK